MRYRQEGAMSPDEQSPENPGHPTGAGIPAALAALEGLDNRPTAAHVAVFEQMHTALTDALSSIDGV
ncbi:hypothetical protein [Pseudonocardia spinosispora]|uniref:hypothetical protein n=1 Tax=Pseudonocardia spinosispora TaxID=103441 RepID=UPI0003F8C1B5|nr:hypothetical protein [Pseudonocardia spinosispora]